MKTLKAYAVLIVLFCLLQTSLDAATLADGKELFELQKFEEAKTIFESILKEQPKNHEAIFLLGRVALAKGESDDSIEMFEKAAELAKNNSHYFLYVAKGCIAEISSANFIRKGMLSSKMKKNLLKAIAFDANNIEARYTLTMYYMQAPSFAGGDKDEAFKQAEEVIKRVPAAGYKLKGQLYQLDENIAEAVKMYEQLLKINPTDTDVYYLIGMAYQNVKDFKTALENFQKAVTLDKEHSGKSLYQIGRTAIFAKEGYEQGVDALKTYLGQDVQADMPPHDAAHWRLGMIYQAQGNNKLALSEFKKAVEMRPGYENYSEALEDLQDEME